MRESNLTESLFQVRVRKGDAQGGTYRRGVRQGERGIGSDEETYSWGRR